MQHTQLCPLYVRWIGDHLPFARYMYRHYLNTSQYYRRQRRWGEALVPAQRARQIAEILMSCKVQQPDPVVSYTSVSLLLSDTHERLRQIRCAKNVVVASEHKLENLTRRAMTVMTPRINACLLQLRRRAVRLNEAGARDNTSCRRQGERLCV
ncbi:hypothetical protein [Lacimicrobium sp. SS2-24]|uniref:hypothetical protein n=1 Tax=Lacimicrobium sp. SS2-24 TaxID=2005569 RepID=UPI0011300401|nr:hypothetical protein [Lacimicrobium sp. SS2-24]